MTLEEKLQACIDGAIFIHETSDDDSSGLQAHAIEVWLKEIQMELRIPMKTVISDTEI